MSGNKFFFEEDAESEQGTGVNFKEQADIFGDSLEQAGVKSTLGSMEPLKAEPARLEMKQITNPMVLLEYGIVDKDYVVHITPTNPQRNLQNEVKLRAAIETTILAMNKAVPFDLQVKIHLPQKDWDIKVLSFVITQGADAWNFDIPSFETTIIPDIHKKVSDICVKL